MNYKKHIRYRQRNTRRVESKLNLILPMHIKKNDTVLAKLEMCLSFHEHSKDFQKRDGHLTLMLLPGSDCPGPHPPAYEQGAGIIHVQLYKLIWTSGWTLLLPFMNLSSVIRLWMCVCVCVRERETQNEEGLLDPRRMFTCTFTHSNSLWFWGYFSQNFHIRQETTVLQLWSTKY